jgi:CBS domain-containing protein
MTAAVASVREDASFREVVDLLEVREIPAVPVVSQDHRVMGVVSEADLLPRMEYAGTNEHPHLFEGRRRRMARTKAGGGTARELMTAPAVTTQPSTSVVEAAKLMEAAGVKWLPVITELGRLVGVVTRHDLLKVFLRSDAAIHADVVAELRNTPGVDAELVTVEVSDGTVMLAGDLDRKSHVWTAVRLTERVDGVIGVANRLGYRYNDVEPVVVNIP